MGRKRIRKTNDINTHSSVLSLEFNPIKDFLYPSGSAYKQGMVNMIEGLDKVVQRVSAMGAFRLIVQDIHRTAKQTLVKGFPPHAIIGTTGAEIIPEVGVGNYTLLFKEGISAYSNEHFERIVQKVNPDIIYISGVHMEYAIIETLKKLLDLYYNKIMIVEDAIKGYTGSDMVSACEYALLRGAAFTNTSCM